jgi:hypothetical protein
VQVSYLSISLRHQQDEQKYCGEGHTDAHGTIIERHHKVMPDPRLQLGIYWQQRTHGLSSARERMPTALNPKAHHANTQIT